MIKAKKRRIAVSVGNFDGFHLGHKKIVRALKKISEKENLISTIMTFIPSPKVYFKRELNLINTDDQKKRILEELGVDSVVYLNFAEIADMSGEDFISKYLVHKCNMDYIVVGENFRFGKNREYNVDALNNMAKNLGFRVKVVKPEVLNGIRISSSFIRERLAFGEIEEANSMLGKLYCIDGSVVEGEKGDQHCE